MEDFFAAPKEHLTYSVAELRKVLVRRGWSQGQLIRGLHQYLILTRPDGRRLKLASAMPTTTSGFALHVADDKLATYFFLRDLNIPQPDTYLLRGESADKLRLAQRLLDNHSTIVIKPVDGAHGHGVSLNLTADSDLAAAIRLAEEFSPSGRALAQEQLTGQTPEVRVICIDGHYVCAIERIPAAVTGDGSHTVAELIDLENDTKRTAPYRSDLSRIDVRLATEYLRELARSRGLAPDSYLHSVPAAGESYPVTNVCNIGLGGTAHDITDSFSPALAQQSETIARAFELPVVGIDYFGDKVLELNANPSLYYPTGTPRATLALERLVDYLERL